MSKKLKCLTCGSKNLGYQKYVKCITPIEIKKNGHIEYGLSNFDENDSVKTKNGFMCIDCNTLIEHCGFRMETEKDLTNYYKIDPDERYNQLVRYDFYMLPTKQEYEKFDGTDQPIDLSDIINNKDIFENNKNLYQDFSNRLEVKLLKKIKNAIIFTAALLYGEYTESKEEKENKLKYVKLVWKRAFELVGEADNFLELSFDENDVKKVMEMWDISTSPKYSSKKKTNRAIK